MASIGEDEKRHAFTVKLGMRVSASGRQSQIDCVQNVKVTLFFEALALTAARAEGGRLGKE